MLKIMNKDIDKVFYYLTNIWKNIINFQDKESRRSFWINVLINYGLLFLISNLLIKSFPDDSNVRNFLNLYDLIFSFGISSLGFRRLNDVGIDRWQNILHFLFNFKGKDLSHLLFWGQTGIFSIVSVILLLIDLIYLIRLLKPSNVEN
tara:strand:- start:735 stop:1178 length:444 start_codon:yes stop_codon:yes gene_type:complete